MRLLQKALLLLIIAFPAAATAADGYKLIVEGLACPICAYRVERHLAALDGVESADVDFRTGTAIVRMAEGATLDETTIRRAIEATGFRLGGVEEIRPTARDEMKP